MRYALMSLSLSQKLDSSFTTPHRFLAAFGITDEIFAVSSGKPKDITPQYMYGLILVPFICWSTGTLLGGIAGSILPETLCSALGIAIYGMFIAIFIPPARKSMGVFVTVVISAGLSYCLEFIPLFDSVSFLPRFFRVSSVESVWSVPSAAATPSCWLSTASPPVRTPAIRR